MAALYAGAVLGSRHRLAIVAILFLLMVFPAIRRNRKEALAE